MGIGRFLNHRVSIVRQVATLEDDEPVLDDYGQPVRVASTIATNVPAGIQPKGSREVADISQAGVVPSTHTIYLLPRDISTADAIVHDASACPMTTDLPDGTYNVTGLRDEVGAAHHIRIDAQLIGSPLRAYDVPVGAGS